MLTKPRLLLSLSKNRIFFTTAKITIMITLIKIIVITTLIIIIMMINKFRSSKPTEDPLCSKKEKDKMVFSFYLCFVSFFRCRNNVLYIYIYIYIYINALSVHTRSLTAAWVCFFTLNFTPSQIIIAGIFWGTGTELLWTLFSFLLALFFFWYLRWPTYVNKEVYLIQKHS